MTDTQEQQETSEVTVQVVKYVDEYKDSFEKGIPLPDNVEKFLKDFNSYNLEKKNYFFI